MSNKLNIDEMPGEYEKRVFIGGNYNFLVNLRGTKGLVKDFGFQPILAKDFNVPENNTHDYDLRLLHNCKYAIFDVTSSAGELMELERCKDYGTQVIVVYQAREKGDIPEQISNMVRSAGFRNKGYISEDDFKNIIREFLFEEDILFHTYLKVWGYQFTDLIVSANVNEDQTSNHTYKYQGLQVVNDKVTLTQEGPHFFDLLNGGRVLRGPIFTTNREDKVKWQADTRKKSESFREGYVIFKGGGLKKEDGSIDYRFKLKFANDMCFTKEEFDERYPNEDFPYEYIAVTIRFPIEMLKIEVNFFEGYNVDFLPLALHGTLRQKEAVAGPSVSFDGEGNKAVLTVKKPKILYDYLIYWTPMLEGEFNKVFKYENYKFKRR